MSIDLDKVALNAWVARLASSSDPDALSRWLTERGFNASAKVRWRDLWRDIPGAIIESIDRWNANQERATHAIALGVTEAEVWELGVTAARAGYMPEMLAQAIQLHSTRRDTFPSTPPQRSGRSKA